MVLLVLGLLSALWLGPLAAGPPSPPAAAPERQVLSFPYFRVPERLFLCGDEVPLNDPQVREDLDREFTIVVWSRAQTTMWLKRAHRYFPGIEQKIRTSRLPLDLKYVVLVESDLRPKARSPVGALGPWQIMGPTAQRFQLKCNDTVDERLELGVATDAALRYLSELHRLFQNWPLALAAYNCGEGRVQKEVEAQGVKSFYRLSLPEESERYVHRVLAAKIVLEDPVRYGYDIPTDELYAPPDYDEVTFKASRQVAVKALAEACGSYYKALKSLNPWIKGPSLAPGSYRLRLPKGTAARFHEAYQMGGLGGRRDGGGG
jgi:membrane-bound lytic murein transglycosylase D